MTVQDLIDRLLGVDPDLKVYVEIGDHIDAAWSLSMEIEDTLLIRSKESMADWKRKRAAKKAREAEGI